MTNHAERKWRLDQILKTIPQEEVSRETMIAKIMFDWGFSRRTTLEYLKVLINSGNVQENPEGDLWRK